MCRSPAAGLLISGYALGVFVGAPILTLATRRLPRKAVLLALMAIFTLGNAACALAPNYDLADGRARGDLAGARHLLRRRLGGGHQPGARRTSAPRPSPRCSPA